MLPIELTRTPEMWRSLYIKSLGGFEPIPEGVKLSARGYQLEGYPLRPYDKRYVFWYEAGTFEPAPDYNSVTIRCVDESCGYFVFKRDDLVVCELTDSVYYDDWYICEACDLQEAATYSY